MSGFGALHLRRLGYHRVRTGLSLVGIAAGSALVVTLLSLFTSVTSSVGRLADLTGRADLELAATTDAGFDQSLLSSVALVRGVRLVAPNLRSAAVIDGQQATMFGGDANALAVGGSVARCIGLGRTAQTAASGVVLGPALAHLVHRGAGDTVTVYGAGGTHHAVKVTGVLSCPPADQLNGGRFAVAFLPLAQELAGKTGRLDGISVLASPGSDLEALRPALQAAAGSAAVVSAPRLIVAQARSLLRPIEALMFMLSALTLVVAGLLVWNTMTMTALERRRELATLRAIGARRGRLLLGGLAEAGLLGLAGGVTGSAAGTLLGRSLLGSLPGFTMAAIGVRPSFILPTSAVVLGMLAGTTATLVASLMPARAAVKVPPAEAFRPEGVLEAGPASRRLRPVPTALGAALCVAGIAISLTARGRPAAAGLGVLQVGFVTTTYGCAGPLAAAAAWVAARFGPSGRLAAASLSRAPRRSWTTILAVSVAVGVVVTVGGALRNQSSDLESEVASLRHAGLWVQTAPATSLPTDVVMPAGWGNELAAIPGVAGVVAGAAAHARVGHQRAILEAVGGPSDVPPFALAGARARGQVLAGTAAVVSRGFANARHLRAGDILALPTPTGLHRLPVAEVVDLIPTADQGFVVLSLDQFRAWYGRPGASWFELRLGRGADARAVRRAAARVGAAAPIPTFVLTSRQLLAGARQAMRQNTALITAMHVPIVLFAALAILNTLMISVLQRRREFGIMRAVGTSRRQLQRLVAAEAGAVGAIGAVLGLGLGVLGHWLMLVVLGSLTGISPHYRFTAWPLVLAAAVALILTWLGAAVPASRASRVNVIAAIGYE